jgi:DNA-directed RNA polymerase subunit RPC12/RpoP/ribosomal protein L40E
MSDQRRHYDDTCVQCGRELDPKGYCSACGTERAEREEAAAEIAEAEIARLCVRCGRELGVPGLEIPDIIPGMWCPSCYDHEREWEEQSSARMDEHEVEDLAKFCRYCGAKIPRDSAFCEQCGTRLV